MSFFIGKDKSLLEIIMCIPLIKLGNGVFESGMSDAGSAEEFIGMLKSLEEKWSSLHQNGKAFHSWFGLNKKEDFIRSVISPVCQRAGLGCPPEKFTTNRSERTNGVLQDCIKRDCGTAKTDKYTLVKSIEKLVKNQEQEVELAVLDKGEYQLRPEFRHLLVAGDKWTKMTNDQKKAAILRVHHVSLDESSPNSVATINTKLVQGESRVFQQMLSARVDWITPDVLKFIAHKAEGLISEGKITELPAASAYATFIIPSRSKPTKPHIIVKYANGKVECQDCQGYSASCLCAHAVAASMRRGTPEAYLKWLVANKRKTGGLNYSRAITFGMPAGRGRKGERPPRSRRGKQSASVVVPQNPSSSVVANQSQNYPDGAQLHNLYPAPSPPSVAAHLMPLVSLYNPPSFPIHGAPFPLPCASTFQARP